MTITTYKLSYTQDVAEKMLLNFILTSNVDLKYVSTYGCGILQDEFAKRTTDWETLKEGLFREHDDLWRELASR